MGFPVMAPRSMILEDLVLLSQRLGVQSNPFFPFRDVFLIGLYSLTTSLYRSGGGSFCMKVSSIRTHFLAQASIFMKSLG